MGAPGEKAIAGTLMRNKAGNLTGTWGLVEKSGFIELGAFSGSLSDEGQLSIGFPDNPWFQDRWLTGAVDVHKDFLDWRVEGFGRNEGGEDYSCVWEIAMASERPDV